MRAQNSPGLVSDIQILHFVRSEQAAGRRAALVTITGLDGPFSRPLGAQLAVSESGEYLGSISGGCLETALAQEALEALAEGKNRQTRYGRGSRFIDVRLPCGGGIDLHIDVAPDPVTLDRAIALAGMRRPFSLAMDIDAPQATLRLSDALGSGRSEGVFLRLYRPALRLCMAGRGWEIVALCELAARAGCEVVAASQETATLDFCRPFAATLIELQTPTTLPSLPIDGFTAVACLFHDREWEAGLLLDAFASDAFYIGALGSRQAHALRVETLRELGAGPEDLERLHAPIGRFATRDPRSLAISALSEIMEVYAGLPGA